MSDTKRVRRSELERNVDSLMEYGTKARSISKALRAALAVVDHFDERTGDHLHNCVCEDCKVLDAFDALCEDDREEGGR